MMTCFAARNYMSQYLENKLEGYYLNETEDHLRECSSCKKDLSDLQTLIKVLGKTPNCHTDQDFTFHVKDIMRQDSLISRLKKRFLYPNFLKIPLFVLCILIASFLLFGNLSVKGFKNSMASMIPTLSQDTNLSDLTDQIKEIIWNDSLARSTAQMILSSNQYLSSIKDRLQDPDRLKDRFSQPLLSKQPTNAVITQNNPIATKNDTEDNSDNFELPTVNHSKMVITNPNKTSLTAEKILIKIKSSKLIQTKKRILKLLGENVLNDSMKSRLAKAFSHDDILFAISNEQKRLFLRAISRLVNNKPEVTSTQFTSDQPEVISKFKESSLFALSLHPIKDKKSIYQKIEEEIKDQESYEDLTPSNNIDLVE